jgi:hypothetical protein
MKMYRWGLKDGSEAEISFSPHFDNLINKYRNNTIVEGIFLMDCGIVYVMPHIMRYCFEADVNLKERKFLRNLPHNPACETDKIDQKFDFQTPLRSDAGTVRNVNNNLVIYSRPNIRDSSISFNPKDVSKLVEGIIKVLDCEHVPLAPIKCIQTIQYYHECLDEKILKNPPIIC